MPKVLVVDDSKVDRRLVCEFLRKESQWTVEDAANGVEALARMKDSVPDLILTDLNMPVMDGLELVTAMREHHPGVPVILITAYGSETLATEALRRGAFPKMMVSFDDQEEVYFSIASDEQLEHISPFTEFEIKNLDKIISIYGSSNLKALTNVDPGKLERPPKK